MVQSQLFITNRINPYRYTEAIYCYVAVKTWITASLSTQESNKSFLSKWLWRNVVPSQVYEPRVGLFLRSEADSRSGASFPAALRGGSKPEDDKLALRWLGLAGESG